MSDRASEADFGRTLRHGRELAVMIIAVVAATVTVVGAAYAMAQSSGRDAAHAEVIGDDNRNRVATIASHEMAERFAKLEAKIDNLERSMAIDRRLEHIEKIFDPDRPPPRPGKHP